MRTVGLILTTVVLGVASAAWWRDFSPTDSLDSLPDTDRRPADIVRSVPDATPSQPPTGQADAPPADLAGLESDALEPVNTEITSPEIAPEDPATQDFAESPGSKPQARAEPLVGETKTQPALPKFEPTKSPQTQAATSAEPSEPVPDQSKDTPPPREQTLALARTELAKPAAVPLAAESIRETTTTEQSEPTLEVLPEASTSAEAVFEVPRIAAELVSERRAATVYFELDKAELLPEAQTTLSDLVDDLQEANAVLRIQIDGHCDDTGSHDYNQGLSEERAEVVLSFLKQHGLSAPDQVLRGFGERVRAVPGTDSDSRALNRRAHVRIDWVRRQELDVSTANAPTQ